MLDGWYTYSRYDDCKVKAIEKHIEGFSDKKILFGSLDNDSDDIVNIKIDYNDFPKMNN